MGCDYYIVKELRIQHENGVEYIEVCRDRQWFGFGDHPTDWDSDDDGEMNRKKLDQYYYEKYIKPEEEKDYTKTIFADGKFVTEGYEARWKSYIVEKYSNDLSKIIRVTLIRRVELRAILDI